MQIDLRPRLHNRNSGIVDQDVDRTERRLHVVDHRAEARGVGEVGLEHSGFCAALSDRFRNLTCVILA
jgi:hypothetical protein